MDKRQFFKNVAITAAGVAVGLVSKKQPASAETDNDNPLAGLWQMEVDGKGGTYHYIYSISDGAWVASANVDQSYQGFKYGPTHGAYARNRDGSYRYAERGWTYDFKGNNVGTFHSQGTFALSADHRSFKGPGTFTQYDLHNKLLFAEPFTAKATKVAV